MASKSDPGSLDTVWTTKTAAKEAGRAGQGAELILRLLRGEALDAVSREKGP